MMEAAESRHNRLIFEGAYDDAFTLAEQLRANGLTVMWEPPDRDRGGVVQDIIVGLVVSGSVEFVRSVISHFVQQHRAKVRLEHQDRDDSEPESDT